MTRRLSLTLLAALPLVASAGSGLRDARPDWISGDCLDYPKHMYLTGVGSADDRATAEDRARAELARIFSTRVVATTSAYAEETSRSRSGRRGGTETSRVNAVSDDTRSSTDRELTDVTISATWQDPATKTVYALATLDRRKAQARLEADLEAINAKLRPLAAELRGEGSRIERGRAALRHRALAKRRAPILADLRVVSIRPVEAPAENPDVPKALKGLIVVVDAKHGPAALGVAVTRGLAAAGIAARSDAGDSPADVEAVVEGSVDNLGDRDGWTWARAEAKVTVRELASGRTWATVELSERQSATRPKEAPTRAVKALAQKLEAAIPGELEAGTEAQ